MADKFITAEEPALSAEQLSAEEQAAAYRTLQKCAVNLRRQKTSSAEEHTAGREALGKLMNSGIEAAAIMREVFLGQHGMSELTSFFDKEELAQREMGDEESACLAELQRGSLIHGLDGWYRPVNGALDHSRPELAVYKQWPGWPEMPEGMTFDEIIDVYLLRQRAEEYVEHVHLEEMIASAPFYLSTEEKRQAAETLLRARGRYPAAEPPDLLWLVAADVQFVRSGRKPRWSGSAKEGQDLFDLIEAGLKAMKLKRDKQGLSTVIARIRKRVPAYGRLSEQTLRDAYYQTRSRQSGKSAA